MAATQCFCEIASIQTLKVATDLVDQPQTNLIWYDLLIENPFSCFRNCNRFCQQVMHFDDVYAASAHFVDEVEVIPFRIFDPQHVVEEQSVTIGWGKPFMGPTRRTNQDLVQFADFRVHAIFGRLLGLCINMLCMHCCWHDNLLSYKGMR